MANDLSQNLIAFLKTDATVQGKAEGRYHEEHVPKLDGLQTKPFVWFVVRQEVPFTDLDGAVGQAPAEVRFDLECAGGKQLDQKALAAGVRAKLHNHSGTFGDSTVRGIIVRDRQGDYIPKTGGGDKGVFVTSYDVQVFP